MSISLTVNRQKLIDQLKAKRTATVAYYDDQLQKLQKALTDLATGPEAWASYHRTIAEGLTDGTLRYSDGGKLVATRKGDPVPVKPNAKPTGGRWHGTRHEIEQGINYVGPDGYYRQQDLHPIDAALTLLDLSDEENIEINGADYNLLLSRQVGRNFRWNA